MGRESLFNLLKFTLVNHCTRTAQSSRVCCSRRVHGIVYQAVKKGNIFVNTLPLEIFIANYCNIKPAVYLLNNIYKGWVIVATAPELGETCVLPEKKG